MAHKVTRRRMASGCAAMESTGKSSEGQRELRSAIRSWSCYDGENMMTTMMEGCGQVGCVESRSGAVGQEVAEDADAVGQRSQ